MDNSWAFLQEASTAFVVQGDELRQCINSEDTLSVPAESRIGVADHLSQYLADDAIVNLLEGK